MGLKFSRVFEELEKHKNDREKVLEIFDDYDTDHSGSLCGYELGNFIDEFTKHLYRTRIEDKADKFKNNKDNIPSISDIRLLIITILDKNRDGKVGKEEMFVGVKRVFYEFDKYMGEGDSCPP